MSRIAIIGAGNVGTALAKRLVPRGHEVMLSYNRDMAKLTQTAAALGVSVGAPEEAVAFGEVVALTVPWAAVPAALKAAGLLAGKILWDCTNALAEDMTGLVIGTTTSGGEEVAKLAPDARVVKGIPPFAELMHSDDPTIDGRPPGVFVAGNDAEAKAVVSGLLEQLPTTVTDTGDLTGARFIEPAMWLLVRLAYSQGLGPRIAFDLLQQKA
jgi:hypothetical protein